MDLRFWEVMEDGCVSRLPRPGSAKSRQPFSCLLHLILADCLTTSRPLPRECSEVVLVTAFTGEQARFIQKVQVLWG